MQSIAPTFVLVSLLAFPFALAQVAPPPGDVRDAIGRVLGLLEGQWRGSGSIDLGPKGRFTLACTLTVASKADGTALLMDAAYSLTPQGQGTEGPLHGEIAVLSFDPAAREYRFDIFYADGRHETGSGRLDGRVLRIVSPLPDGGFRRLSLDLSEAGVYHETGERSRDRLAWQVYSDIVLKRVGP